MHRFISGLSILFHWSMSLLLCQYHAVLLIVAFYYALKFGAWYLQLCCLFSNFHWLFGVFYDFQINLFYFCEKNVLGIFIRIVLNQRNSTGREEGGGFRMGNTCIPVADSCWYMAKPIQYCKVKQILKIEKKINL